MNLNQLEYFITVAETLNFTRAAEKCFITQTAITQQIKALEQTVGVPLFIRDKHHVELTPAGKIYLSEARVILERHAEALRLAKLVTEGEVGEITIGFINGYGKSDFSELLRNFHNAYPNIKIKLMRNNLSVLRKSLETGKCDIIFAIASYKQETDMVEHRYIRSYPVMAVLPEGHVLAQRGELTYKDLREENFIMMQPANRSKSQMEESILIYERGGYIPNVVAVEGEQETLLLMISVGMGISLIPEYITRNYAENRDLKILPLMKDDGMAETVDFEVCWKSGNTNPAVEKLLDFCR